MSNSIWKTPTVRPVKDCIVVWQNPAHMSFTLPRTACKYMEKYNCERWATLDDLIAQANKAERLQKAVDCALEELQRVAEDEDIDWLRAESARTTITEIKQLIKENQ